MTTIPKPKFCEQNWLEMNPTNGGRICGQCDKKIIDFSKMSWYEIEKLQIQNNNTLCGIYDPQQLDNWGKVIPTYNNSLLKAFTITGLAISFATSSYGQTINTADSIVIKGKIIDEITGIELPFVNLVLKNSKVRAVTDIEGNFKLVLKNIQLTPMPDTLEINHTEYIQKEIVFRDIKKINASENKIKLEAEKLILTLAPAPAPDEITSFYVVGVYKPTLGQRIKRKFRKWFGRKK